MSKILSHWEYCTLKLSYPLLDTSTLVKISSRIKTPNVCELMDKNDYEKYEKQQRENDLARKNREFDKLLQNIITQPKFNSYFLLPGANRWRTFF